MTKKPRILFMGTPAFAAYILDALLKNDTAIVGVVTAPDKPAGRGRKMHSSAVKQLAEKHGLPVFQPKNLKSDAFQATLKSLAPDISVVVAFRMLPKAVWAFPKLGTFNLHASLLPDYRGAAPINWAIINGEERTGLTTFFLDDQIDTGKIIAQETVPIARNDNAESLHYKLMAKGAKVVSLTLKLIAEGKADPKAQPSLTHPKPAPKLNDANTRIDWTKDKEAIYNQIRGLSPFPAAWTFLENGEERLRCKLFAVEPSEDKHDYPIGKLIKSKKDLKVAVRSGFIHIREMQLPGKKKMPIVNLLNGLRLSENAKLR